LAIRVQGLSLRDLGLESTVQGVGLEIYYGLGFRVQGQGSGFKGLDLRIHDLQFRVDRFGFRVQL